MLRRHDLAVVSTEAWRAALAARPELADLPLVAGWAARGWPLVVRRSAAREGAGVPLGLPLPPSHQKLRLPFVLPHDAIVSVVPPPMLARARDVAPPAWRPTLDRLVALAASLGGEARIYGSLAWQLVTGLDYLTSRSDLDLLLALPAAGEVARLTAALAAIEREAPMRIDGELVRADGAGVSWRELHACSGELLVKTITDTVVLPAGAFLEGAA